MNYTLTYSVTPVVFVGWVQTFRLASKEVLQYLQILQDFIFICLFEYMYAYNTYSTKMRLDREISQYGTHF
jgi:hypothetical protein